jgi:hypothetical protein
MSELTREQSLEQERMHLINALNQAQGQINFLENRIREVMPPVPSAEYPSMDMPKDPEVKDMPIPADGIRANAEGVIEIMPDPSKSPIPPPPEGKMRIMIGVPILAVSYEFFESFLKFWTMLCVNRDPRYEITYHFAYRRPVHMAEEYLVKTAQFNKCTHLLLMDDDIFDVTIADLNKLIDAKKDFISGVMHASKFPHAMCVFRRYDTTKRVIDMPADTSMYRLYEVPATCPSCNMAQSHWDVKFCPSCGEELDLEIQPCDLTPFPFTLIDLKVFDKIKKPWFHCTNGYPTDSWFMDRLLEAGIQPYAHMTVRLNHAGVTDETKPHFMNMGMAKMQKTKAVVNLSPDQMEIHQNLLVGRMKSVEEQIKPKPPVISEGVLVANPVPPDLTLVTAQMR